MVGLDKGYIFQRPDVTIIVYALVSNGTVTIRN
jgi:hypothetical protein